MDTTAKLCRICRQVKPATEFSPHHTTKDRLRTECRACIKILEHERYLKNRDKRKAQSKAWKENNPERYKSNYTRYYYENKERINARVKEWVKNNPERRAVLALKSLHKITVEPTRKRPEFCEVCGSPPGRRSLALDHCHETGLFRGWLCVNCNTTLGKAKDNIGRLMKLADYLKAFNGTRKNI